MTTNTLNNPLENVCGIYDVDLNTATLDNGKVLIFRTKKFQEISNRDVLFDRLNKWTHSNGYTEEGEVICVMN